MQGKGPMFGFGFKVSCAKSFPNLRLESSLPNAPRRERKMEIGGEIQGESDQ
jgi:hypothetical protein